MNKHTLFAVIVATLLGGLITIVGVYRYNDFYRYHETIAQNSVNNLSYDISSFIKERERLVHLFGEDNHSLIQQLINSPDDYALEDELKKRAKRFFPTFFSISLADNKGKLYLEDYDGLMGDLCITDIKLFADQYTNKPRIHPHVDVYHFDIMTKLTMPDKDIILFISFRTDVLATAIHTAQVPGHQLLLLYPIGNGLIEVTSNGPRNLLLRDNYILTSEEVGRHLSTKDVAGTAWIAKDFYQPPLFIDQRNEILIQFIFLYIVFLSICFPMLSHLKKEEQRRKQAENHKNDFLSSVSHELRTPLTAINGALSLVCNGITGSISEKTLEMVSMAQQNCTRLTLLVNDLLDLQKIEAGKMQYIMADIVIYDVLERAVASCQQYAELYDVKYQLSANEATSPILVNADENRITQVLINLFSNAAKYGANKDTIEITLQVEKNEVVISIVDHGNGIPDDLRDILFGKFTRSKTHQNSNIKGTGLGLHISKQIMDAHQGDIGCHSKPGHTNFYISLPINKRGR